MVSDDMSFFITGVHWLDASSDNESFDNLIEAITLNLNATEKQRNRNSAKSLSETARDHGNWYCVIDGESCGPFGIGKMRILISEGDLTPDTLVWDSETDAEGENWRKAADTKIASLFYFHDKYFSQMPSIDIEGETTPFMKSGRSPAENEIARVLTRKNNEIKDAKARAKTKSKAGRRWIRRTFTLIIIIILLNISYNIMRRHYELADLMTPSTPAADNLKNITLSLYGKYRSLPEPVQRVLSSISGIVFFEW